ncbi:unnamed protein product [Pleuronectes platessa]|uniref:Uncharacterized protein n=1 Tax=Pleuronectes platessa TaxID=8262 RepID=A0A9N7VF32_PLEPL|nr:unnamed protein product [Pleuronectes platessa]
MSHLNAPSSTSDGVRPPRCPLIHSSLVLTHCCYHRVEGGLSVTSETQELVSLLPQQLGCTCCEHLEVNPTSRQQGRSCSSGDPVWNWVQFKLVKAVDLLASNTLKCLRRPFPLLFPPAVSFSLVTPELLDIFELQIEPEKAPPADLSFEKDPLLRQVQANTSFKVSEGP